MKRDRQLVNSSVAAALAEFKPRIVCICGSTRFIEQMAVTAWEFEKGGVLALGPHLLPNWPGIVEAHQAEFENVVDVLDTVHLRKIAMSDLIYVVNVNGYMGDRTKAELSYAKQMGKKMTFFQL